MPQLIPTINVPAAIPTAAEPIVWGLSPLFDFNTGRFVINNSGDLQLGNEAQSLSQWMTTALTTPRMRYAILGNAFGSDFDLLYGNNYPESILKQYAETIVRNCLADDRIVSISVDSRVEGKSLYVTGTIVNRTGFEQQFQAKWSV
jgi:uncharacterized protein DUF2634